eukprot:TRINITY_DN2210_c0_g1_i5.p1 TRINITY_DN2210_c0_g1~~TRINITY_DN2210_c0_g1_i5.p1  ORF type:complete len:1827 (+),score=432.58 TRINITY_DN2210_c0_g1_i5:250-5481(+)
MSFPTVASTAAELSAAIEPILAADFGASVGEGVAAGLKAARITGRVFASLTKEDVAELFPNLAWGERRTLWLLAQQVRLSDAPSAVGSLGPPTLAGPSSVTGAVGGGGSTSVLVGREPTARIGTGPARSSPRAGLAAPAGVLARDTGVQSTTRVVPVTTAVNTTSPPAQVPVGGTTDVSAPPPPLPPSEVPVERHPAPSDLGASAVPVTPAVVKAEASAGVPPVADVEFVGVVSPVPKPVGAVIILDDDTEEEAADGEDDTMQMEDRQGADYADEQFDEDNDDEDADEDDRDDDESADDMGEDSSDAFASESSDASEVVIAGAKGAASSSVSSAAPRVPVSTAASPLLSSEPHGLAPKRPRPSSPADPAKRARTDASASQAMDEVDEITPVRPTSLAPAAVTAPRGGSSTATAAAAAAVPAPPTRPLPLPPSFVLGICGPTGAGKSTVLNAILDGCNVLPTSAMRACTAVPIEIRYKAPSVTVGGAESAADDPDEDNLEQLLSDETEEGEDLLTGVDSDGRFGAEIEFIGLDEWTAMLTTTADAVRRKAERRRTLEDSLTHAAADPAARAAAMEQFCDGEDVDEAGASAAASVKAVLKGQLFPSLIEFQVHCQTPAVQAVLHFLGQTLHFYGDRPADISRRIARFLATTTGTASGPSVWPLVRKAVVSGPWALLSGGLTLVDLPGLGDANSARNSVVAGYIDRCHGILATAPITRARDNKSTKDIFQHQARVGVKAGRITFLALLATQADNVDVAEIVDELGSDFMHHYRIGWQAYQVDPSSPAPSMTSAALQLQQVESGVSALNGLAASVGVDDALYVAAQSDLAEKTHQLRSACIVARNGAVAANLANQYKEDMADALNPASPPGVRTLSVFTVSAVEYEKIMREGGGNAELSSTYTDVRATGIPPLLDALWALSNTSAAVRARGLCDHAAAFSARSAVADDAATADIDIDALEKFLNGIFSEDAELGTAAGEAIAPDVLRHKMEQEQEAAVARRQATVAESSKALQDRTRYLSDISALNKRAATALDGFLRLCSESSTLVASKRRLEMWLQQARDLVAATVSGPADSAALIAVLGDSGAGKSTLLNALLQVDDGGVLPVSGVRACTAAPIEISYRAAQPGSRYEATIEFLTADEWHTELAVLLSDLTDAGVIKKRMARPLAEGARLAYDRVFSVYGRIDSLQELQKSYAVEKLLGSTVTLRALSPKLIRQQLEDYVSSKGDGVARAANRTVAGRVWPIVKMARLKGPFSILADCGGRLLDLPGLQDSNAARNAVVQSFLSQCSSFLIAAPIRRAIDNKTARELLGRQFRRQLLLDGRMGSVALVATATDDLDALHVAAELGIRGVATYSGISEADVSNKMHTHAPHVKRLRKRVSALAKRRGHLEMTLRRATTSLNTAMRSLELGVGDTVRHNAAVTRLRPRIRKLQANLNVLRGAINKATVELRHREQVINHLCATARNAFCRVQLRADFAEGVREVMAASLMSSGVSESDVADEAPVLPVFAVSSRDYQNLRQQNDKAVAFYTLAQTEVPSLHAYVRHNMLVSRAAAEARRSDRIELLITSLTQYLTLEDRATPAQQKALSLVTKNMSQATAGRLNEVVKVARSRMELALLKGPLAEAMDVGHVKACRQASSTLSSIERSMHWASFRACVKRFGTYTSPTAGHININQSMSAPAMESAMQAWRSVFGVGHAQADASYECGLQQGGRRGVGEGSGSGDGRWPVGGAANGGPGHGGATEL